MKSVKIFGLTFFLSLVVLLSAGAVFMMIEPKAADTPSTVSSAPYLPKADDNLSVLLIGTESDSEEAVFFAIARFDAENSLLTLSSLPKETLVSIGTKTEPLSRHFEKGGGVYALRAVRQALRISIDRFAVLNENSLLVLADTLGGVSFDVPRDLSNDTVHIPQGLQQIDGRRFRDIVLFDTGDDLGLELAKAMIEQKVTGKVASDTEIFQKIMNETETNISSYDFEARKEALFHWGEQKEKVRIFAFDGNYDQESSAFSLSEESVEQYRRTVFLLPGQGE